jgi:hypothetical protein
MYFKYDDTFTKALEAAAPDTRMYFIGRPGEFALTPAYRIYVPGGPETLDICVVQKNSYKQ